MDGVEITEGFQPGEEYTIELAPMTTHDLRIITKNPSESTTTTFTQTVESVRKDIKLDIGEIRTSGALVLWQYPTADVLFRGELYDEENEMVQQFETVEESYVLGDLYASSKYLLKLQALKLNGADACEAATNTRQFSTGPLPPMMRVDAVTEFSLKVVLTEKVEAGLTYWATVENTKTGATLGVNLVTYVYMLPTDQNSFT